MAPCGHTPTTQHVAFYQADWAQGKPFTAWSRLFTASSRHLGLASHFVHFI
jgi:hypothetical protein